MRNEDRESAEGKENRKQILEESTFVVPEMENIFLVGWFYFYFYFFCSVFVFCFALFYKGDNKEDRILNNNNKSLKSY